ncbi:MAG: MFS transporter, partial [Nocardioidaceae bacterium]
MERLPFTRWHWRIIGLAIICWLAEAIDIGLTSAVIPSLKSDFGLSASTLGLVATASTVTIVVGLLVAGPTIDRFGKKIILLIGLLLFGLSTLLTALASSITLIILLRGAAGLG